MNHIVSVIYSESGISIEHDGGVMPGVFQDISSIELSSNGNDVMILGNQSGSIEKHIVKNGILQ